MSGRFLVDLNKDAVGFKLNLGYLASSGSRSTGPMYGGAVEIGRGQIFTMMGEYWSEPGTVTGRTKRALLGGRMNLWWLQLEVGVEKGLSDDLPSVTGIGGVQIHTSFGGSKGKSFSARSRRVPLKRDLETRVRVAVVNFSGFEDQGSGVLMADKIKTVMTQFGHVRVIEVGEGTEFMDPDAATRLAQVSGADAVITGRILRHDVGRMSRPNLPLVVGFPQTIATLEADVRVIDSREDGKVLSARIIGNGRQNRGVKLFPTVGDDRSSYLSVVEKERIWDQAATQAVAQLFGEMAGTYDWVPK